MELSQDKSVHMISPVAQFVQATFILVGIVFADRTQTVGTNEHRHLASNWCDSQRKWYHISPFSSYLIERRAIYRRTYPLSRLSDWSPWLSCSWCSLGIKVVLWSGSDPYRIALERTTWSINRRWQPPPAECTKRLRREQGREPAWSTTFP